MPQNVVSRLLEQHDRLRHLFDDVENAGAAGRVVAWRTLAEQLTAHEAGEQDVVYPALRETGDEGRAIAADHASQELQAKEDLAALERIGPGSPDFDVAFKTFRSAVEAHAEAEEAEVFPILVRGFDEGELQQLARQLP